MQAGCCWVEEPQVTALCIWDLFQKEKRLQHILANGRNSLAFSASNRTKYSRLDAQEPAGSRECSLVNLFLRKTLVICYDKFHLGPKLAYAVCVCFSWNRCCISEDCCESSCHFVELVPSEAVTAVVF